MEGGDTGGYSHGVLKSMMNDECRSSFCFVFIPGQSLSSVGTLFPYVGGRFQMWAVVLIHGRLLHGGGGGGLLWLVLVFGCHVADSNVAPGFPVSKESAVGTGWRCLTSLGMTSQERLQEWQNVKSSQSFNDVPMNLYCIHTQRQSKPNVRKVDYKLL